MMQLVETINELRTIIQAWRKQGDTIAFVPTMGNLHAGHLHLVEKAKQAASRVVVSIFVNPTQFGEGEDFAAYPRTPQQDAAQLQQTGADLLFMPAAAEVYPADAKTWVEVAGFSEDLCGLSRPGHFRGVATVVCKLLNMVQADVALFGEKDRQQLAVIRCMVRDLNLPVQIVGVPTVREGSGLAMSSRNGYLSDAEKQRAALLYQSLLAVQAQLQQGRRDYAALQTEQAERLTQAGFAVDYFAIRCCEDLTLPDFAESHFAVLVAARLGKTRLIDNLAVRVG